MTSTLTRNVSGAGGKKIYQLRGTHETHRNYSRNPTRWLCQ